MVAAVDKGKVLIQCYCVSSPVHIPQSANRMTRLHRNAAYACIQDKRNLTTMMFQLYTVGFRVQPVADPSLFGGARLCNNLKAIGLNNIPTRQL